MNFARKSHESTFWDCANTSQSNLKMLANFFNFQTFTSSPSKIEFNQLTKFLQKKFSFYFHSFYKVFSPHWSSTQVVGHCPFHLRFKRTKIRHS